MRHFHASAELSMGVAGALCPTIDKAIGILCTSLSNGNKILACGNGGSAADCQHFAAELMGRFERERMPLPAVALTTDSSIITAIGNDYDYAQIFSKQVAGLGQPGDVLLAISTSGNSLSVLLAIEIAKERDMLVIGLTGKTGGTMRTLLRDTDIHICVAHDHTARIQEMHAMIIHCLCDGIDHTLFGSEVDDCC